MEGFKDIKWYKLSIPEVVDILETNLKTGVTSDSIANRQKRFGKNNLPEKSIILKYLALLFSQIVNPLIMLFIISGALLYFLGIKEDAYIIFLTILINIAIGFYQEEKVSRIQNKLKKSNISNVGVIRGGNVQSIDSRELVPGDIVILKIGMSVPADIRIIESAELNVNESIITGEWNNIFKNNVTHLNDLGITDRTNMLWSGTTIVSGLGKGIVVKTGKQTELGKIVKLIGEEGNSLTGLQVELKRLSKFIIFLMLMFLVAILIFALFLNNSLTPFELARTSIAISIAAVPIGLPSVITVLLVIGMRKIFKRGGLVKHLVAAETLGSASWILTDKTGTLTTGKMKISGIFDIKNVNYYNNKKLDYKGFNILEDAYISTDAEQYRNENNNTTNSGYPIERAIFNAFVHNNKNKINKREVSRILYLPFTSERRHSSAHIISNNQQDKFVFVGLPEYILAKSKKYLENGEIKEINENIKKKFEDILNSESKKGRRIIAVAFSKPNLSNFDFNKTKEKYLNIETEEVIFNGIISFEDPIRDGVRESIDEIQNEGIIVNMVTGDNKYTALEIAKQAGILETASETFCITGDDFEKLQDEDVFTYARNNFIFARMLPKQKHRLLRILKGKGEIVAMTGDGVNDAPALRAASIGISTQDSVDIAKEESDFILFRNNFNTIVYAIEEGKRIIYNLKKIIVYLLSTSFTEVSLIGVGIIIGYGLPILPIQILWANLIEESFIGFSFAFEKYIPGRSIKHNLNKSYIFTKDIKKIIGLLVFISSIITISTFIILAFFTSLSVAQVQTSMFILLSIDTILLVMSLKDFKKPLYKIDLFDNFYLLLGILASLFTLLLVFIVPYLHNLLNIVQLPGYALLIISAAFVVYIISIELIKAFVYKKMLV